MTIPGSIDFLTAAPQPGSKVAGAAKDFEGLLLAQILKSSHAVDSEDDAGSAAVGFAEEQVARAMAANGGLGLAKLIEKGLNQASAVTNSGASSSE